MEFIENAITKAERLESRLSHEALAVPGFTSLRVRHFLNNLCSCHTRYLEIGIHKGATLASAMYENEGIFIGIDNFVEFNNYNDAKDILFQQLNKLNLHPILILDDCWKESTIDQCPGNIEIYFYDGAHDYDSQRKALNSYYDKLAKEFIFIVDDWNWENTRYGTIDSIADQDIEIFYEKHIFTPNRQNCCNDHWWNGLGIFGIKKL